MITRRHVSKRWVHSHEEDTDDEMVFRPAGFKFPPSRGREHLELRPDGTYTEQGIGADDRPEAADGTWKLDGDQLRLASHGTSSRSRVLTLAESQPDRLVVRR